MNVKSNKVMLAIIPLLVVIVCLFVWLDVSGESNTAVYSENGVWDLRGLSFENGGYKLSGSVEYIPNALLTPEEFAAREGEAVVGYPEDVSQYATSRIRILLPEDGYYTFSCRSIDYSERVYVNGEWILDIGSPGDSKETTIPNTGKISLTLKPKDGVIEIVQQASNFAHREGGGHAGWNISAPELRTSLKPDFHESIKLGCFLALFFVHIILFLLMRSYRANLYFALFCLMWFLRTGVTGAKIFTDIFPWLPWVVKFRIEYLAFPVTAALLVSLLDALFPGILHKWFRYALYGVSAVIAALFLFADTVFMSYALLWCEALYIPAIVYIIVRFVMKLRSVNPEQVVFLAGVGMFFCAAVHDMLYYNHISFIPVGDLSSVSMLLLTFCEAAAVFIATVRKTEKVAAENATLKASTRLIENRIEQQEEQFNLIAENTDRVLQARHDLRHHLSTLRGLLDGGKLGELERYLSEYSVANAGDIDALYCWNARVNALLCYYAAKAKELDADVQISIDLPRESGVSDLDLCVVIGNCFENAVAACVDIPPEKRRISLNCSEITGSLMILLDNSFNGKPPAKQDGRFLSSKHDGVGGGLASVTSVAEKYGGMAEFTADGDEFRSEVELRMRGDYGAVLV